MIGALILSSFIASAVAAPAIVWKEKDSSSNVIHSSEPLIIGDLVNSLNGPTDDETVNAVYFLVGRDSQGNEGLTGLAGSGFLPKIAEKHEEAHTVHHHVWGIDGPNKIWNEARNKTLKTRVTDVPMCEFNDKLTEGGVITSLTKSDVVIVKVSRDAKPSDIDNAVVHAIEHKSIKAVVLTALRGTTEVKQEINMMMKKRRATEKTTQESPRRRLDENQDGDNNNGGNNDKEGVYYVNMTPNIFAGLLFTFFFIFLSMIGFNCMGNISNSDIYVSKMPSVGREA